MAGAARGRLRVREVVENRRRQLVGGDDVEHVADRGRDRGLPLRCLGALFTRPREGNASHPSVQARQQSLGPPKRQSRWLARCSPPRRKISTSALGSGTRTRARLLNRSEQRARSPTSISRGARLSLGGASAHARRGPPHRGETSPSCRRCCERIELRIGPARRRHGG
jgi:hypothetical protein